MIVNRYLATTNPDVYAVGDAVSGTPRLTHVAGEHAKVRHPPYLAGADATSLIWQVRTPPPLVGRCRRSLFHLEGVP